MGNRFPSVGRSIIFTMKILVVVLALATLAQAEPEADPAVLYGAYYGYPYGFYGWRGHSAYGYATPGAGYTHVSRLHKRDAAVLHTGSAAPGVIPPHLPVDGTQVAPTALTYGLNPASVNVEAAPIEATVKTVVHAPVAYHYPYAYGGFYGRRKREADPTLLHTGSAAPGVIPPHLPVDGTQVAPTALTYGLHPASVSVEAAPIEATVNTVVHAPVAYAHPYAYGGFYGRRKREADAAVLATGSAVVGSLPHAYALKHPEGVIGPTALPGYHSAAVTGVTPGAVTATVHHTYPYAHYPYHFGYAYGK